MGDWEIVKFATKFMGIKLVKQEHFCGAIALTYFVEKLLRFTLTVFIEGRHLQDISYLVSKNKSIFL